MEFRPNPHKFMTSESFWPPDRARQIAWSTSGWRRGNMAAFFAKIVHMVTGPEATYVCQGYQLCAGLKAGIDGAIHGFQALWDENLSTEESGFPHRSKERVQQD